MVYFQRLKKFVELNEQCLSFLALMTGFTIDSLTLTRIDLKFDNIILLVYLFVAAFAIILINTFEKDFFKRWVPYAMQFAFGGLFSGYVIFYSRSATLAGSWPFIVMLLVLLIGNEFFKKPYQRLTFQTGILYTGIFSFLIFSVPIFVGSMGATVFIVSGILSIFVIRIFIWLLNVVSRGKAGNHAHAIKTTVYGIFITFNILYFTNLIPPIPLSLKQLDVYYNVERAGDEFIVSSEPHRWYEIRDRNTYYHRPGDSLYAFSAVFAPTTISTNLFHEWYRFNDVASIWELKSKVPYSIKGGRDGGFRGFSLKKSFEPGEWRIDVVTERKQLLGRKKFLIKSGPRPEIEKSAR